MKKYLLTSLKGACMGAADVIPGVSGGTIAFIMGIYDEFVGSIASIDAKAVKMFFMAYGLTYIKNIKAMLRQYR